MKDTPAGKDLTEVEYVTCIRPMCEHDEGWHAADSFVRFELTKQAMDTYAPYLARVMSIIKSGGNLASEMRIFFSERGRDLVEAIEGAAAGAQSSPSERPDMSEAYVALRRLVADEIDNKRVYSLTSLNELNRIELDWCELHSGKLVWLCPNHTSKTNATVIRDPATSTNLVQNTTSGYNKMIEFIKQDV